VSLILEALDRIKSIMADLEATGAEPAGDDKELIDRLDTMAREGPKVAKSAAAPVAPRPLEPTPPAAEVPPPADEIAAAMTEEPAGASGNRFDPDLGRELKDGEVSLADLDKIFAETPSDVPAGAPASPPPGAPAPPASKADSKPVAKSPAAEKPASGEAGAAAQSIRVNVDLLENMMNLVSELVLTRNQLLQMMRSRSDSEFAVPLQGLSHVTTELQESVMKTRMQPIGNAWQKLPRIVRDLAAELGKKIELVMEGAETELDRQVLELIKDPLTHMVRNSGDHGLETPADRAAAGKPEIGRIVLNAHHEGGYIIIQISDDGRGINIERVRQKVLEQGLATEAELGGMSDQQVLRFIFAPGFSTAAKVTAVSGRGVGMDVVKTNIDKIGGTVDIKSATGKGSTFTIKIPLTLAIISALVVECESQRYAIPQLSVVELVRTSEKSEYRIETINATPVLRACGIDCCRWCISATFSASTRRRRGRRANRCAPSCETPTRRSSW
jgi:two-component system chemotaxis sensor kinase CheA